MVYVCPMHPQIRQESQGRCPLCGMRLEKDQRSIPTSRRDKNQNSDRGDHNSHTGRGMRDQNQKMSFWQKFKMSMSMTMGMEHGGLAGREMARLMEEDIRNKFFFSLVLTIPIVAYSPLGQLLLGISLPEPIPVTWILFLLTTPVYLFGGWIFLYSSYKALQKKTLNMAVLIAVGITAAYGFSLVLTLVGSSDSYYEASAMLITFVLFGHFMEMKSRRGTTDALQALFALVPPQARLLKDGREETVPTASIQMGDVLVLKPGDKVAVDGEIIEGETAIDESLLTGESIPVSKVKGSQVVSGSINLNGSVKFRATKVGGQTALAQIVKMVETAQNSKAPGQRLADRFAQYLVIAAVGGGFLTFAVWYFLLGQPFMFALSFAISTVVIACPDALGLATPTAVAVGTGLGAKHNILIKDAATLERVSKIQAIVLDKTGTLTEGKPTVTDVVSVLKGSDPKIGSDPNHNGEILRLMASVEAKSSHPLSRAILEETKVRGIKISEQVEKFSSLAGLGVEKSPECWRRRIPLNRRRRRPLPK